MTGSAAAESIDRERFVASPRRSGQGDDVLRLLSLNLAHGRLTARHQSLVPRRDTERNLERVAAVVRDEGVDLAALQEADGPSAWSGNFDHVATIARLGGLSDHVRGEHNPFRLGRYDLRSGTALVSAWKLAHVESRRFGLNWRDTKGFVVASVRIPRWDDLEIDLVSVHLDFLRPTIRRRQVERMVETLRRRDRPRVLLGDLNCCFVLEPSTLRFVEKRLDVRMHAPAAGSLPTYPARRPRRRLDWIMASRHFEFVDYRTLDRTLSDHRAVIADLRRR
ncbi:MAG: endonuclease/exonuclease/phosphatase family protein [Acidobacteriota bacterium]